MKKLIAIIVLTLVGLPLLAVSLADASEPKKEKQKLTFVGPHQMMVIMEMEEPLHAYGRLSVLRNAVDQTLGAHCASSGCTYRMDNKLTKEIKKEVDGKGIFIHSIKYQHATPAKN